MDLKANKVNTTSGSITPTTFTAQEWNQIIKEKNNILKRTGLTPSSSDLTQMTHAIKEITYDTSWVKPDDWIDIRSAALPNSIYFLFGQLGTSSTLSFYATVSSGTYDVYVDGVKYATTASGSKTSVVCNSSMEEGYRTSNPTALMTHIIRVTPTTSSATITRIYHENKSQNTLWVHFTIDNEINLQKFLGESSTVFPYLKAITSYSDAIKVNDVRYAFGNAPLLEYLAPLDFTNTPDCALNETFYSDTKLYKVTLIGLRQSGNNAGQVVTNAPIMNIDVVDGAINPGPNAFYSSGPTLNKIKHLPSFTTSSTVSTLNDLLGYNRFEDPVSLDFSYNNNVKKLTLSKAYNNSDPNVREVTVSPEAPFDSTSIPQVGVAFTGLDKESLANLFSSLPSNVAYEKVGNPTIVDGVASGFSASNYLRINNFQDSGTSCELNFTFTTPPSAANACLFYANHFRAFFAYNGARLDVVFNSVGSQETGYIDYTFDYGTKYTVNILRNGTTAFVKIYKGTTLEKEVEVSNISAFNNGKSTTMVMGYENIIFAAPFNGSIDLNHTYIKVNGKPWFGPGVAKNMVPGGTIVGSPTVTNGVMSGFSSSNYINLSNIPLNLQTSSVEIGCKISLPSSMTISSLQGILTTNYTYGGLGFLLNSNGKITARSYVNGTWNYSVTSEDSLSLGSDYYLKQLLDLQNKTNSLSISQDGVTWTTTTVNLPESITSVVTNPELLVGNQLQYNAFGGSIDLNNTYIKVDGSYWYRGMVHQEKICDVRGCAGTLLRINGSPTITDGILSASSAGNYVNLYQNPIFNISDTWEFCSKFKHSGTTGDSYLIDWAVAGNGLDIAVTPTSIWWEGGRDNNWIFSRNVSYTVTPDVWYWIKVKYDGRDYTMGISTDKYTWTQLDRFENLPNVKSIYYTGIGWSQRFNGRAFKGSIDLNETYLKVNGGLWFSGEALAEKEKNIALNKGWSLTLV